MDEGKKVLSAIKIRSR